MRRCFFAVAFVFACQGSDNEPELFGTGTGGAQDGSGGAGDSSGNGSGSGNGSRGGDESGDNGDAPPPGCGNGALDEDEHCDGADFGWRTCASFGFAAGVLACNADCSVDTSACTATAVCGDEVLAYTENCDGDLMRGWTCENQGAGAGELRCGNDCTWDASDCGCAGQGESCAQSTDCCPNGWKGTIGVCDFFGSCQ